MTQPSPSHQGELKQALEAMSGLDYVREEEVAAIPVVQREVKHVIYGPLADFPLDPEVVLLFAHAQQGLILSEAAGRVDKGVPPAMGRPACAVGFPSGAQSRIRGHEFGLLRRARLSRCVV